MSTMLALGQKGCATRKGRAALRREIRAARPMVRSMETLAAVLDDEPQALRGVLVWDAIGWVFLLSDRRRRALLRHAGIGEYRQVGELTGRQRDALCHLLRSPALLERS